ncbi:hypothetical protein VTL71DRAFT_2459 [Oculimacula yallundae]|uniref:Heterokaryon incompatibility domain-containing protein n=1 Tax=Oculimacula yallundae TaxID=86028 RepID=A0ABR4C8Z1_9HELO
MASNQSRDATADVAGSLPEPMVIRSGRDPRWSGISNVESTSQAVDESCVRCRKIDLRGCLIRGVKEKFDRNGRIIIAKLGPWEEGWEKCSLCSIFAAIRPRGGREKSYLVSAYKNDADLGGISFTGLPKNCAVLTVTAGDEQYIDGLFALVEDCGYQNYEVENDDATRGIRHLSCDTVEWSALSSWLRQCDDTHVGSCKQQQLPRIPFLRMIHCEERTLVSAPENCRYIALSYVWGTDVFDDSDLEIGNSLPCNLPRTIEDSLTVAKKLRVRYLWIDRYCIPQNNLSEKQSLIEQMDKIYRNAYATIIQAAGSNPRYGLPGVSASRAKQTRVTALGYKFTVVPNHPLYSITTSHWVRRGWTYQEGILSRRRICFTDDQVYFECGEACCFEVFHQTPWDSWDNSKPRFRHDYLDRLFPHDSDRTLVHGIFVRIREYTERELTYPDDILNGALGFLRTYEDTNYPITQFWGVPIMKYVQDNETMAIKTVRSSKEAFIDGILSFNIESSLRRQGFPSWSWTGWYGKSDAAALVMRQVEMREVDAPSISQPSEDVNIWIEYRDGERYEWSQVSEDRLRHNILYAPFIHIEAYAINLAISYLDEFRSSCYPYPQNTERVRTNKVGLLYSSFSVSENYTDYNEVHLRDKAAEDELTTTSTPTAPTIGVLLGHLGHLELIKQGFQTPLLLVRSKGTNYECIGTTHIGGGREKAYRKCHHGSELRCGTFEYRRTLFLDSDRERLDALFIRRTMRLG